MASRYWLAKWSSGYVGTNDEEAIDLVVDWSYEEKDVESMTDEEAEKINSQIENKRKHVVSLQSKLHDQ